jgi:hypothetical protein
VSQDQATLLNQLINSSPPSEDLQFLEYVAQLVNLSGDLKNEIGLIKAIALCEDENKILNDKRYLSFRYYFCGNAFYELRKIRHQEWVWEIPEAEKEIFYLRKALDLSKEFKSDNRLNCEICTNLANALNFLGRFVEAMELYGQALNIDPQFSMAQANRGMARCHYGKSLYDQGQCNVFQKKAYDDLINSIDGDLEKGAKVFFQEYIDRIKKRYPIEFLNSTASFPVFSLGNSEEEIVYRKWCLREKAFLNPLNDLVCESIAAQDILSTPPIVVPLGDGMYFQGMFNQLKQEYVTARYLFYESICNRDSHFSDSFVTLVDTSDYPCYGFSTEKLKTSFRMTISLFDKIGFFINRYFEIGEKENRICFRSIWYEDYNKRILRKNIIAIKNWPLRGLYWLSKDFLSDDDSNLESAEPEAIGIIKTRNYLEHKFLVVHDMLYSSKNAKNDNNMYRIIDPSVGHRSRHELEETTLKVLKLARGAIIYLALAIHLQEHEKRKRLGGDELIPSIAVDTYEDTWKR